VRDGVILQLISFNNDDRGILEGKELFKVLIIGSEGFKNKDKKFQDEAVGIYFGIGRYDSGDGYSVHVIYSSL